MKYNLIGILVYLFLPSIGFSQYFGEEIPKPSTWSFGLKISASQLDADISPWGIGKQGGFFLEKTLARTVDLRIEAQVGQNWGLNLFSSNNHQLNNGLNGMQNPTVRYDSSASYFHNYQHTYRSLGFHLKLNLNRIITVLGAEKWDLYALGGLGAYAYETKMNALDKSNRPYNFSVASVPSLSDKIIVEERLNSLFDGSYESLADRDLFNNTFIGTFVLKTYFMTGGGIRFHLTKKMGIGVEANYVFFGDDHLDGQQWNEDGSQSLSRDKLMSAGLLIDFAF